MKRFLKSFVYAFEGIGYAFRTQRNLRIHSVIAAIVILAGIGFRITAVEWALISISIGLVFSTELINTVAETAVDLLVQRYHPQAKVAKDAGAGAVLVAALGAVGVGIAIFGPRLWRLVIGG